MAVLNLTTSLKDTTLVETGVSPSGAGSNMVVGRRYIDVGIPELGTYLSNALIQFDLATLPSNAIVSSAIMTLRCAGPSTTGPAFTILGIDPAKAWVEAEADWDEYATGSLWTAPGGDFDPLITDIPDNLPTTVGDKTYDVTTIVQSQFTDQSQTTIGVLMYYDIATVDYATFITKEFGISARWPRLSITYTEPVQGVVNLVGNLRKLAGGIGG